MKRAISQTLPRGWTHKRIHARIDYYDRQTDDEGAAEIETAEDAAGETWMSVPAPLVPAVARLIEDHQRRKRK
jgi:hypothetical protein